MSASALRHTDEGGKEHDDENIITGGSRHDELRNAFGGAALRLHQLNHPWNHHRRGNGSQYGAHHRGFDSRDAENVRGEKDKSENFETGRQKRHQDCRPAYSSQIRRIQGKTCFQKDDDQRRLAQFCRYGQNRRIQKIQRIGAQNDSCNQHTDNPRQFQTAADTGRRQTDEKDECERCQHDKFLLILKNFFMRLITSGGAIYVTGFRAPVFAGCKFPQARSQSLEMRMMARDVGNANRRGKSRYRIRRDPGLRLFPVRA